MTTNSVYNRLFCLSISYQIRWKLMERDKKDGNSVESLSFNLGRNSCSNRPKQNVNFSILRALRNVLVSYNFHNDYN